MKYTSDMTTCPPPPRTSANRCRLSFSFSIIAAFFTHPPLQATIVASVGLTSAYTPLLKPMPLVKNLVVAAVVGAAIAAGGLAAGASVAATMAPSALTFFVIGEQRRHLTNPTNFLAWSHDMVFVSLLIVRCTTLNPLATGGLPLTCFGK